MDQRRGNGSLHKSAKCMRTYPSGEYASLPTGRMPHSFTGAVSVSLPVQATSIIETAARAPTVRC